MQPRSSLVSLSAFKMMWWFVSLQAFHSAYLVMHELAQENLLAPFLHGWETGS